MGREGGACLALLLALKQALRLLLRNAPLLQLELFPLSDGGTLVLRHEHRLEHDAVLRLLLVVALLCPLPTVVLLLLTPAEPQLLLFSRRCSAIISMTQGFK